MLVADCIEEHPKVSVIFLNGLVVRNGLIKGVVKG